MAATARQQGPHGENVQNYISLEPLKRKVDLYILGWSSTKYVLKIKDGCYKRRTNFSIGHYGVKGYS